MQINDFYSKKRIWIILVLLALFTVYIIVSYGRLSLQPVKQNITQNEKKERGSILDRSGKPLAVQVSFYHFSVTPSAIKKNQEATIKLIAPYIGLTETEITSMISNSPSDFLYLKKRMTQSEHDALLEVIKKHNLQGLKFDEIPGRIYPENELASQVIGFMGTAGNGLSGMEYSMQAELAPPESPDGELVERVSSKGKTIYLTIDANLQYKLEKIASEAMENTQAENIMLIAAEAKTGEILSYISLPSADLNHYPESTPEEQTDRPAVIAYEPGSVFKVFSVASFLDAGAINPNDVFICDGKHEIYGSHGEKAVITCLGHHGSVTAREALQYSCNDALAQMSEKVSAETFLAYIRKFGFGSKTGIELPGETRGSVKNTDARLWSIRSKQTMSIGQEISVSALQMVQAATAIANKGTPLQLTLVSKITTVDGSVEYEHVPQYKDRVIAQRNADYLLSCMETTARSGTGTKALLGDVSIGVKTGTAQMLDTEKGGYSDTDFVSNCIAIFPIEEPEVILYIVITKAKGETYAGRIVAPVIGKAADVIIDHLGMARSNAVSLTHSGTISFHTEKTVEIDDIMPNLIGTPKKLLTELLSRTDLHIVIEGEGYVSSQSPEPGTKITENMNIELKLE